MTRFLARNVIPEFTVFASFLRMTAKYGFSDVREALVEHLKGAVPTKWEDFETAKILGENVFGLPKPHPNVVLNLPWNKELSLRCLSPLTEPPWLVFPLSLATNPVWRSHALHLPP